LFSFLNGLQMVAKDSNLFFFCSNRIVGLLNRQLTEGSVYDLIQEEIHETDKYYSIDLTGYKTQTLSLQELAAEGYPSLKISA